MFSKIQYKFMNVEEHSKQGEGFNISANTSSNDIKDLVLRLDETGHSMK